MAPTRRPHPNALFRLVPIGALAEAVLDADQNRHLVSQRAGVRGLDVGAVPSATRDGITLATLGREGDIVISHGSVSRIQCAFQVNKNAKTILCVDRSTANTTQLHGCADAPDAVVLPFLFHTPRRVYVGPGVNPVVGMCGVRLDRLQFRLEWAPDAAAAVGARVAQGTIGFSVQPAAAPTIQDSEAAEVGQHRMLRQTWFLASDLRTHRLSRIGSGAFGTVYKAVNVNTGDLLAVKVVRRATARSASEWQWFMREVKNLKKISHPCIVELLGTQGWESNEAEIFLGLMDGSLDRLTLQWPAADAAAFRPLVRVMLHHMLQALDALHSKGLIHRDVKPANILYAVRGDGQYRFRIGDFGISNVEGLAVTYAGTDLYMAPELYGPERQTHKVDVWSLYVTALWTTNCGGFRDFAALRRTPGVIKQRVLALAAPDAGHALDSLCEMGVENPALRASPAQMLVKLFDGEGLSTPRAAVPPLPAVVAPSSAGPKTT